MAQGLGLFWPEISCLLSLYRVSQGAGVVVSGTLVLVFTRTISGVRIIPDARKRLEVESVGANRS